MDRTAEASDRKATLVLLVRHGEQETLREMDPPLSPRGREQAQRLADRLATLPVSVIAASPLLRAQQTAEPLALRLGMSIEVMEDLHEARSSEQGHQHVFTKTSAAAMDPLAGDYAATTLAAIDVLPTFEWGKNGFTEERVEIERRMARAVDSLVERHPGGIVVVLSHGGAINCLTGRWVGAERDMWFVPWHTGINAVLADGDKRTVLFINDSSHLVEGENAMSIVASAMGQLSG